VHGLKVAALTDDDQLTESLSRAFSDRYKRMLDTCLTGADIDPSGLTHRLSSTETNCEQPRAARHGLEIYTPRHGLEIYTPRHGLEIYTPSPPLTLATRLLPHPARPL
jgi:hypothetical protein